jgi:hypothetical protein
MAVRSLASLALLAGLCLWPCMAPVDAHHSFAAEFDVHSIFTMTGTVTKIQWTNPHAHFFIDVKDAKGQAASWDLELGSPNTLMRDGWSKTSLKIGDVVTVRGFRARNGSNFGSAKVIMLGSQRLFGGSSYDDPTTRK